MELTSAGKNGETVIPFASETDWNIFYDYWRDHSAIADAYIDTLQSEPAEGGNLCEAHIAFYSILQGWENDARARIQVSVAYRIIAGLLANVPDVKLATKLS